MDLYSKPQPTMYNVGLRYRFMMPVDGGDSIPAVAVSKRAGQYYNSGYTIMLVFLSAMVGKILMDLVITHFPLRGNGNRHAMLTAFINVAEPIAAMLVFGSYVWKLLFTIKSVPAPSGTEEAESTPPSTKETVPNPLDTKETDPTTPDTGGRDWKTFGLAAFLFFFQLLVFAGGNTAGIIIPTELLMGNVAIVNPSAIFFPAVGGGTTTRSHEAHARLTTVAAFQAIGTVQYSEGTLRERVTFGQNPITVDADGRANLQFDYRYNLTGYDFGLQNAAGLEHHVTGHCQTEYDWLQPESNSTHDIYHLWGDSSLSRTVPIPGSDAYIAPRASFTSRTPNINASIELARSEGTVRFSILPHTAGRRSLHEFDDTHPWYVTEPGRDNITVTDFIVRSKRPAISCVQTTKWSFQKFSVSTMNIRQLAAVQPTGLKVADFWLDTVFPREFGGSPPLVEMSNSLGNSNLAGFSQIFTTFGRIDNSAATLESDLQNLVMGSFVYSREVVRNTATLSPNVDGIENVAQVNGTVPVATADFVLESPDVQTLSLRVLIAVPLVMLLLCLWILFRKQVLSTIARRLNKRIGTRLITRSTGLSAVQLYRYLDEEINGLRRWEGRLGDTPYIKVVPCDEIGHYDIKSQAMRIPVSAQDNENGAPLTSVVVNVEAESRETEQHELLSALASKYAIPRKIPLYRPKPAPEKTTNCAASTTAATAAPEGTPSADDKIEGLKVIAKEVSDPPLSAIPGKYELAMVSAWRPKFTPKPKPKPKSKPKLESEPLFNGPVLDSSVPTVRHPEQE